MPIAPSEVAENLKAYMDETGGNDGPPEGMHQTVIMKGQTHPTVKMSKDGLRPELFLICQISEGQYERRTVPVTLRWFVAAEDRDGNPKTDEKMASGEAFVRKDTREFLQAIWGKDFSGAPEGVLIPAPGDSEEEVYEVFKDLASVLPETPVGVTVTYREGSDFPNLRYRPATSGGFSL